MFDVRGLRRSWWGTPLAMTGWLLVLLAPLVGPAAVPAAIVLGVLGLLAGWRSSARAKAAVGKAFKITFLPSDDDLAHRVGKLAANLGLPPPTVGVMGAANALAVGSNPNEAAVVLGLPLFAMLDDEEMDAVIGHELGHIATRDVHRMQVAEGYQRMLIGLFSIVSLGIVAGVTKRSSRRLAMLFSQLGRMTLLFGSELVVKRLSRKREFHADAIGAALTSPAAMANALRKLHGVETKRSVSEMQYAHLMFRGARGGAGWFSTHPSLEQRLEALETARYLRTLRPSQGTSESKREVEPSPEVKATSPHASMLRGAAERVEIPKPRIVTGRPSRSSPKIALNWAWLGNLRFQVAVAIMSGFVIGWSLVWFVVCGG